MEMADMGEAKIVKLIQTGETQSVVIPAEFALPGRAVRMHRDGDRLVIEPFEPVGLLEWLATLDPIEDEFPDFDEGMLPMRDVDL